MAPRVSIVTPVFDPPLGAFLACVDSVLAQTYPDWEWCLVDDCSTRPEVVEALREVAGRDPRIRVQHRAQNGGIVAASNDALALATGEFVALLDHDDAIVPTGLAEVMQVLDAPGSERVDYLYTDESHVAADGQVMSIFPKPAWSPERFRASMYTCHLSVLRRTVVEAIGGFRPGFDGSQDHDLILRATEHIAASGRSVAHLPSVTYHWRHITSSVSRATDTLSAAVRNGRQAVQDQCDRLGFDATVEYGPVPGTYRVVRHALRDATVTVVVATRFEGAARAPYRSAVEATVRSLEADVPNVRFLVAHPASSPAELVGLVDSVLPPHWHRVPVPGTWSVAGAIDRALLLHPADVVVSLAPGLTARTDCTPDWLGALVGLALSPGAGAVGALIADRDDVVLHAGWDVPRFRYDKLEGQRVGAPTSGNDLLIERECTQVHLAAAAMTAANWREAWHVAGSAGFAKAGERISGELFRLGCRTLFTPYARFDRTVAIEF
jgi:hypothetical protein